MSETTLKYERPLTRRPGGVVALDASVRTAGTAVPEAGPVWALVVARTFSINLHAGTVGSTRAQWRLLGNDKVGKRDADPITALRTLRRY
jgi:hypothetical protein